MPNLVLTVSSFPGAVQSRPVRGQGPVDATHALVPDPDRERMIDAAVYLLRASPTASIEQAGAVAGLTAETSRRLFADRDELLAAVRERA